MIKVFATIKGQYDSYLINNFVAIEANHQVFRLSLIQKPGDLLKFNDAEPNYFYPIHFDKLSYTFINFINCFKVHKNFTTTTILGGRIETKE